MPKELEVIKESNKKLGDKGEQEVVDKISCPNCSSKLMLLPPSFPLVDVQCTRCVFRAQVKTVTGKPRNSILGAGYDIYEKVLKAGYLSPSLLVNFRWKNKEGSHREIRFYPFIAKGNIQKYTLSENAIRANYKMFRYVKLDRIPFTILHTMFDPLGRFDDGSGGV